jgi:hypothetical protein
MSMNEVGYKKPPKHAQFQPGKSGNPKGRPKGAKSPTGLEVFDQTVTVIQKGKKKKITAIAALLTQVLNDAMKGDHKARKLALDIWAKGSNKAKVSSLTALATYQSPFELSEEDEANIAKHKLLKDLN